MASDTVLGVRFPVLTIAGPDHPHDITATRRESTCRSSDATCLTSVGILLALFFSRETSRTSCSPAGSHWRLTEGYELSFEIAH